MSDQINTTRIKDSYKLDDEILQPAFDSNLQAFLFLALIIIILVLPVIITKSGLITRRNSYEIMPENQGAYSFVMREIFDNKEDIDILFAGSSVTFGGIDTPQVQKDLSNKLGRPARVMTFGHYFNSMDVTYTQIRDLLERKRVRLIVLSIPRLPYTDGPSAIAYRFVRYNDDKELFDNLSLKSKISLYACGVLRTPRDLMTIIRPNLQRPSPFAKDLGADKRDDGMGRKPEKFKRFTPTSPSVPVANLIYSPESKDRVEFINDDITYHQNYYLEKLIELLKRNKVPVMIINIPQHTEIHSPRVIERKDWSKSFGMDTPLVGVQPSVLFAGLSEEEIELLFFDDIHFNTNGNEFYTRTVLPAILEVYDKHATKRD